MAILAIYRPTSDHEFYIEKHDVVAGQVQAGIPLQRRSLTQMAKSIISKDVQNRVGFKGLCPKNLLSFSLSNGEKKLLWLAPAQKRPMFFTPDLKIPNGEAHQPNLIFFLDDTDLSVFAIKDENVSPETELFIPPFHNLSREGKVCMGTTRRKDCDCIDDLMAHWENAFYFSYFSHAGNIHDELPYNINTFWKKLIEKQSKFPLDALLPTKKCLTIKKLLHNITINNL